MLNFALGDVWILAWKFEACEEKVQNLCQVSSCEVTICLSHAVRIVRCSNIFKSFEHFEPYGLAVLMIVMIIKPFAFSRSDRWSPCVRNSNFECFKVKDFLSSNFANYDVHNAPNLSRMYPIKCILSNVPYKCISSNVSLGMYPFECTPSTESIERIPRTTRSFPLKSSIKTFLVVAALSFGLQLIVITIGDHRQTRCQGFVQRVEKRFFARK